MSDFEKTLIDAMARRCGLEPPDEFAARSRGGQFQIYAPRGARVSGTGRTARMLLQALVAHESGATVEVVGSSDLDADRLRRMTSGLLPGRSNRDGIRWRWEGCEHDPNEAAADLRLVDHTVTEAENFAKAKEAGRRKEHARHEDGRLRTSPFPTGSVLPGFTIVSKTGGGEPTVNGGLGGSGEVTPKRVTVEDWETLLERVTALEMVAQAPMLTLRSTPDLGPDAVRQFMAEAESHGLILDPTSEATIEPIVPRDVVDRFEAIEGRLDALEKPADPREDVEGDEPDDDALPEVVTEASADNEPPLRCPGCQERHPEETGAAPFHCCNTACGGTWGTGCFHCHHPRFAEGT